MNEEFKKIIEERKKSLPEDINTAIDSIDLDSALAEITKRNNLLIDQSGLLFAEITLALYGIEPLSSLVSNLSRELSISTDKANKIAKDADDLIFRDIRANLKELNRLEDEIEQEKNIKQGGLSREQVLDEIENPQKARPSGDTRTNEIEINLPMNTPENDIIINKVALPQKTDGITVTNSVSEKKEIENILEANLNRTVSLPKEQKIVEEKTKLPQKGSSDPYREPIE
jgi:hypothetical protein